MSHIPNNAMPHAASQADASASQEGGRAGRLSTMRSGVTEKVREYPKTAAAAGAALAAGLVAAAAIPALRARAAERRAS